MKHEWPIVEEQIGSRQWIFDRVVRHYRAQPRRCPAEYGGFYRLGEDRCFVGALIDDAFYNPEMEGTEARNLANDFDLPPWFKENLDLITGLQSIHDDISNWTEGRMNTALELFAFERGLRMPL